MKKKKNSYWRLARTMALSALAGGVMGFVGFLILGTRRGIVENGMAEVIMGIQQIMLPLMALVTVISVIYGEINLRKQKHICDMILKTEDEECDRWEYEEEKNGAWGTGVNILSQILCILVLSAGYSANYIESGNAKSYLAVCIVFLICFAYDGIWQVRYVKLVQRTFPEKKGDPATRKFRQEWLESCDEAERTVIYQSAYKAYSQANTCIPILLVIAMLGQLFFETGLLAIVIVAAIWLIVTVPYLRSCVRLKGEKIRE